MGHLAREGPADRSVLVGDVMVDVLLKVRDELAHPRLRDKAAAHGIRLDGGTGNVTTRDPLSYPDLVGAASAARGVITDSIGLQKEAFVLGTPCTTVRTETQ